MRDDTRNFIDCLQDAGRLLEDYPTFNYAGVDHALNYKAPEHFDLALFEKWSEFFEPTLEKRPPVRVVQHLSCTGGTIICKCLAGLPNVALLSEVNPLSTLHVDSKPPGFAPTDLIFLSKRAKLPNFDKLSEKIFKAEIAVIAKHAKLYGKHLVIREHSHSDFLEGETPNGFSAIGKFLKKDHPLLSVLTVRHPVDSYLSMVKLGWGRFSPKTFDEYCKRYLLFIHHNENVPVYKYEDFVIDPSAEMERICQSLDLPFNDGFLEVFDLNALSGDSGRSSHIIEKRERRKIDEHFQKEMEESVNYKELCKKLNYAETLDSSAQFGNDAIDDQPGIIGPKPVPGPNQ
jgi:hypothetical protein